MRWGPNAEEAVYVHIFDHPVLFVATGEFDRFVEGGFGDILFAFQPTEENLDRPTIAGDGSRRKLIAFPHGFSPQRCSLGSRR